LPVIVFVAVNAILGLQAGIWSAIGCAVLITVVRLVRKEPLQPAISGFLGVAVAAFIAYRTGSAKGFFAYGIWMSLVFGVVTLASVVVRWPLVGVVWSRLNGADMRWRRDRRCLLGYDIATLAMALVFGARFVVQRWLYNDDATGWLAVAKIGMGYPLWGLALLVAVWAVRRSDRRLRELAGAEEAAGTRPETDEEAERRLWAKYGGAQHGEA
jgi:hypothetical protein